MVNKYQKYVDNLHAEGVDPADALVALLSKFDGDGVNWGAAISGTREEFEIFTDGFTPEKKERVRKAWGFVDG